MANTWREELAWSAGFFDGEGHVGSARKDGRRIDLYLNISQVDRRVLDRFRAAVACGRVVGPYLHPVTKARGNEQPRYYFQTQRFESIQHIIAVMWAFLSPVKREQALGALRAMRDRYTHSPTCKYGHPWTPENTYYSGKNYRHCKACRRKQWADYRERERARDPKPVRDPNTCSAGHDLTADNVYTYGDRRMCKRCAIERTTKARELKRMAAALLEA